MSRLKPWFFLVSSPGQVSHLRKRLILTLAKPQSKKNCHFEKCRRLDSNYSDAQRTQTVCDVFGRAFRVADLILQHRKILTSSKLASLLECFEEPTWKLVEPFLTAAHGLPDGLLLQHLESPASFGAETVQNHPRAKRANNTHVFSKRM